MTTLTLTAPLFTDWTPQHLTLQVPDLEPGTPCRLTVDGEQTPMQYTGARRGGAAEVMVRLGFAKGQTRTLRFTALGGDEADALPLEAQTLLQPVAVDLAAGATIGHGACVVELAAPTVDAAGDAAGDVAGPFASVAGRPMPATIRCETALEQATLTRTNAGPLYTEYALEYRFGEGRFYRVQLRAYRAESYITVREHFGLRRKAALAWTWNPGGVTAGAYDRIMSHRGPDFENEVQPTVQALGQERFGDVLCRMQMPVLSEYFVPNNRYYWALFREAAPAAGMVGVMGLRGDLWEMPVEGMPIVYERGGTAVWTASLESGVRHWLLHAGELETAYTTERRLVYHRLHAEHNALRLDAHLDLTGESIYDSATWRDDAVLKGADFQARALARVEALAPLQRCLREMSAWDQANKGRAHATFVALVDPTPEHLATVHQTLLERFERWVRQFQGWRAGQNDYMKNVIGFSRWLRGQLIAYELLRKLDVLSAAEIGRLNAYFVFAARRITDEGRWPHERTWVHPRHPESVRDLYTYGGEHKPDKLVWTNSLPNFQSDPMCALAHLAALFPEHPDAAAWQRKALDDLERQLGAYQGESGAWEESINYALYTLSYFTITFRALKYRAGMDYFNDPRMRAYISWLARFFGPVDARWDVATFPAIGNATLPCSGAEFMLAYAGELPEGDPLRDACIGIYQATEDRVNLQEHYGTVLAAMAPIPDRDYPLPGPYGSECMDEIGVAMRHGHLQPKESYLFQKIGMAKDHYEADESAFNWYAKGLPLTMDYGTYTGDIGTAAAHNLVEIPDADPLHRGFLADHSFTAAYDYTRCEMPVTLKLMWDKVRTFDEVDGKDGVIDRMDTPYFYIGDPTPVGPKVWKSRQLLWIKPDYIALLDKVYGEVPHRWNLHTVADATSRDGQHLHATGRFGLDLRAFVQHPAAFDCEQGETIPKLRNNPRSLGEDHAQRWFRVYNRTDGLYRTVLFAQSPGQQVTLSAAGDYGMCIKTLAWTDYVFLHHAPIEVTLPTDGIAFSGRVGWIRRWADGRLQAGLPDGDAIAGWGLSLRGRGPWSYGVDLPNTVALGDGPPRTVSITHRAT